MTAPRWTVFAGIGHPDMRSQLTPIEQARLTVRVDAAVRRLRDEHGAAVGISPMDAGFGLILARAIVDNGLQLWAYRPGRWQADTWPPARQREWEYLCGRAACVKDVSPHRTDSAYRIRDRVMFDTADVGLAWWNGEQRHGLTYQSLAYAIGRCQLPMIWIDPVAVLDVPDEDAGVKLPSEVAWRRGLGLSERALATA